MKTVAAFFLAIVLLLQCAAQAVAKLDNYVVHYLHVRDPIQLPLDAQGTMVTVTAEELSDGKRLFESNCINCHVGGATLPNPTVTLSMDDLAGANPPRTNLTALMEFQREPIAYDGSEESFECRKVPDAWMDDITLLKLEAFILKAAEVAPGWGPNILDMPPL
ncbi:photosystem II cytochrome PsbV2 [Synechococcus sp. PCC 7336]|uniref:photosystem II cytochrome PsbV2 n=1 Tax=Synechococcus sp. PCC 7336 TaxID=195250 RepID=UPI000348DF5E|nr:photosystem II cytochrome PsbV2 [Synechococcus sp. PCC 7336]